jgi:signal transduction histidine kinase
MRDQTIKFSSTIPDDAGDNMVADKFVESFASFNRIINILQRQYIELKEEFTVQNEKLAEANLRLLALTESNLAANQFLYGILDALPLGVITIDREGRISHLNPTGSILFSKECRKTVGMFYSEVFPETDCEAAGALKTIKTGQSTQAFEREIIVSENRKLILSVSTALLKDEEGNCVGAIEVFQDMTKVRKMEHEIARLNTLAALGEMAATIAHEIRNPLSAIGGFAALLERDIDSKDPKMHLVHKIKKGVETLNSTVTRLLNYTRFNELNRIEVDFLNYLKMLIEQFRNDQVESAQALITVNDGGVKVTDEIIVSLDKLLFRQCIYNVLSNGMDAAAEHPTIEVAINVHPAAKIPAEFANKISLDFDESLLVVSITDNGQGIKVENRDRVFAPFFTTKGSGSGLGLAVAWKLIKAHGGEIFLGDSSPNGTTFYILMPARLNQADMESKQ